MPRRRVWSIDFGQPIFGGVKCLRKKLAGNSKIGGLRCLHECATRSFEFPTRALAFDQAPVQLREQFGKLGKAFADACDEVLPVISRSGREIGIRHG